MLFSWCNIFAALAQYFKSSQLLHPRSSFGRHGVAFQTVETTAVITVELLLQNNAWGERREKWDTGKRDQNKALIKKKKMKREAGERRQTGREKEKWSIKLQNRELTEHRLRRNSV